MKGASVDCWATINIPDNMTNKRTMGKSHHFPDILENFINCRRNATMPSSSSNSEIFDIV
jgi:hypothetical protein